MSKTGRNDSRNGWMVPLAVTSFPAISFFNRHLCGNSLIVFGQTIMWKKKRDAQGRRELRQERGSAKRPQKALRDDYPTAVATVIPHTLRNTVERNSQTQKQSKLQSLLLSFLI